MSSEPYWLMFLSNGSTGEKREVSWLMSSLQRGCLKEMGRYTT